MRLYEGSSVDFIEDAYSDRLRGKLRDAFLRHMNRAPLRSEEMAWTNSLRAVSTVFSNAGLTDHGVLVEYQLPLSSLRLDCMICGRDGAGADRAVILELKQWSGCQRSEGENEVVSHVGGRERDLLHPSVQADRYRMYLEDGHTAFHDGAGRVALSALSYLHNYHLIAEDPLLDPKFRAVLDRTPLFSAEEGHRLERHLTDQLSGGHGSQVLQRIDQGTYLPSRKLLEHVGNVIRGQREYVLLDEQLVVYDRVRALADRATASPQKTVMIVNGGPGTGKSVIAMNLLAHFSLGRHRNAHYATGSRAFTGTLRKVIGPRGGVQFNFFNSYAGVPTDSVDVLIADEAHRIRKTSSNRFTRREARTGMPQIEELISAARTSVFFIDDDQVVRPEEIGSSRYIREAAERLGCRVLEHQLEAQFRCQGSEAFVNWVNHTLGIRATANEVWTGDSRFDFQIFDSPEALESAIREKAREGSSARMTAGFCWPWSDPRGDGTLPEDVVIGGYRRAWNAQPEATRLARGIPKAITWAYDEGGIDQVGCVYTAQGFEFDYVGVIFGKDLRYDPALPGWRGFPESSCDTVVKRSGERFLPLVQNTYRVLLTRGLKGCYVYFQDPETERFVRSRVRSPAER